MHPKRLEASAGHAYSACSGSSATPATHLVSRNGKERAQGTLCVRALRPGSLAVPERAGFTETEPAEGHGPSFGVSGIEEGTFWGMIQSEPELKAIGISGLQLLQVLP